MGAKGGGRGSVAERGDDIVKAADDGRRRWESARGQGWRGEGGGGPAGNVRGAHHGGHTARWGAAPPAFIGARHTHGDPRCPSNASPNNACPCGAHGHNAQRVAPHKRNGSSHQRNFPSARPRSIIVQRTVNPSPPRTQSPPFHIKLYYPFTTIVILYHF